MLWTRFRSQPKRTRTPLNSKRKFIYYQLCNNLDICTLDIKPWRDHYYSNGQLPVLARAALGTIIVLKVPVYSQVLRNGLTCAAINSSVSSIVSFAFSWGFWFLSSSNNCMKSFRCTWLAFRKSMVCFTMPMKNCCTSNGNVRSFNALNSFGKNTRINLAIAKDGDELSTAHPIRLNSD